MPVFREIGEIGRWRLAQAQPSIRLPVILGGQAQILVIEQSGVELGAERIIAVGRNELAAQVEEEIGFPSGRLGEDIVVEAEIGAG